MSWNHQIRDAEESVLKQLVSMSLSHKVLENFVTKVILKLNLNYILPQRDTNFYLEATRLRIDC